MSSDKLVIARCKKKMNFYGLVVSNFNKQWKVIDAIPMTKEQASVLTSEVRQSEFFTNDNLLPCPHCGNRKIGGCNCTQREFYCTKDEYHFPCIYCSKMEIDYDAPKVSDINRRESREIVLEQGKKVRVTFNNVTWKEFDKILFHAPAGFFSDIEPKVHVIANEQTIEFNGYNVSEMNEGVYYTIQPDDDFDILCDIDTSTVQEHPIGFLYIEMGPITAQLNQAGGSFLLNGKNVISVGQRFKMYLSLTKGGEYSIEINDKKVGSIFSQNIQNVEIRFGFWHESHCCASITKAFVRNIQMSQVRDGMQ